MPVRTQRPDPAAAMRQGGRRIVRVRADRVRAGDRILHEGRPQDVLRVEARARIELLLAAPGQPGAGLLLKLRDATMVERVAA